MKTAIVTCGLLDSMLPLVRHLAQRIELDLYVFVYGEHFTDAIGSSNLSGLPSGLIDEATTEKIMDSRLLAYARQGNNRMKVRFFKYPNLKIADRQNIRLHWQFATIINKQHYDLVHLNGYRGALIFLYAFLHKKPAKVWTIHDPVLHSGEDRWQTRLGYHSYRFLKAHFIVHNQAQHPAFVQQYSIQPDRCHFVRFGPLDVYSVFQNGQVIEQEPETVLFYGRISPYKGVEYLIEAAKIARKQIPGLKVIIAGKPNYPINLDQLKDDPGFEIIDRFIQNEELVKLIRKSCLVVCPYTDATQSGVIMTAYAFHTPVLATAVGGLPEVVEEGVTGRLVPPRNAQALADALIQMLQNTTELAAMRQAVKKRSHSGKFSWDGIADETVQIYQKSLAG